MKRKAKITIYCALICLLCGCSNSVNSPVQTIDTAMGTIVSQTLYLAEDGQTDMGNTADEILSIISALEQDVLSRRIATSEIGLANTGAGSDLGMTVSDRLKSILETCQEVSQASEGAFDITIGAVVRLWDIDSWAGQDDMTAYNLPTPEEISMSLETTGYDKMFLEGNQLILPDGMQLDLGAVGKGIALDEIKAYLGKAPEVGGATISVGGSVLTFGEKENGAPWKVAVVDPLNPSRSIGYLSLKGTWCVSTSGNYERYVEIDGIRYHHIIDPRTGHPANNGITGVTILAKNGLLSDALSTACFVLGTEKGMALAEYFGAEAIFVDEQGKLYMTDGMMDYFHG